MQTVTVTDIATLTLLYAGFITIVAPLVLNRGRWCIFRPRLALWCWWAAFLSGVVASFAAAVLAVIMLGRARHGGDGVVASLAFEAAAWIVTLVTVGALALAIGRAEIVVFAGLGRRQNLAILADTRQLWTEQRAGYELVVLDADQHVACSIPGREAKILLSQGLLLTLSDDELRAVLCHEEAHLAGRHNQLARLAEVAATCTPWLPASRDLRRSTALLVELAADDHARRCVGADATAAALAKLAVHGSQPALTLRAERASRSR